MLPRVQRAMTYLVAVLAVVATVGLKFAFRSLGADHPFLLLPAAVIVATWFGGRGPGLLATALAALGTDLLFLSPFAFETSPGEIVAIVFMLAEGVLIVWITDGLRAARERARSEADEADRAHRSASLALEMREELLRLWSQKLAGPLAHVLVSLQRAREAVRTGDLESAAAALDALDDDVSLLQRTADRVTEGSASAATAR